MSTTLDHDTIDAARERAKEALAPYLTHQAGWGVPPKLGITDYAKAIGWRLLLGYDSGAVLFVKESAVLGTPRFRLAEYVDGDVTFFGFPTEHDREQGIRVLSEWHELVAS